MAKYQLSEKKTNRSDRSNEVRARKREKIENRIWVKNLNRGLGQRELRRIASGKTIVNQ